MSSFHYTHTRERERDRNTTSPPPALPHRTSFKRPRLSSSDDENNRYDDYPYAGNHRPSRALVKHDQPSQLERWGIWTDARKQERCDSAAEEDDRRAQPSLSPSSSPRPRTRTGTRARRVSFVAHVDRVGERGEENEDEDEERAFQIRVATLARSRPRLVSPPPPRRRQIESDYEKLAPSFWPGELFRTRGRCFSEEHEARERARGRSREQRCRERGWYDDGQDQGEEVEVEKWVSWRRVKRTRVEECRPLAGWRRP